MSSLRSDDLQSLINIATGQGVARYDPLSTMSQQSAGVAALDQEMQSNLRRKFKILRKIVEVIPNQMTYRWGAVTLGTSKEDDDQDKLNDLKNDIEQWLLDVKTKTIFNEFRGIATGFNQAQKTANETGNAALILMVDDGRPQDEPLGKIKTFEGFFMADRWAIKPDYHGVWFDPDGKDQGITHYILTNQKVINRLSLVASNGRPLIAGNQRIHKSRVLWFRGEELSDRALLQNHGCDDSVLEGVYQSFREYNAAIRGAGRMLVDFDIYVHYIKNYLNRAMADGSESKAFERKMQDRLQANSLSRSAWRGMVADLDDEKIETITRNVGGYPDLVTQILSDFLSNTDLQPSELLQKYPEGLANTGKTEQQNCNIRTRMYQGLKFDSNIRKLLTIIFNWKEGPTKGKEPEKWNWTWHELYPTTPLEQSELELNWAQINTSNIQNGIYTSDDAAKSLYGSPEFNPHITIDFEAREQAKEEQEAQALALAQEQAGAGQEAPVAEEEAPAPEEALNFDSQDLVPYVVKAAAKKGLEIRRSLPEGAVPARVAIIGRKLSSGQVSAADIKAVAAYHQKVGSVPSEKAINPESATYLLYGGAAGAQWAAAQLTARTDGQQDAPNLRDAAQRSCATCVHFVEKGRNNAGWEACGLYGFRTSRRSLCDSYSAKFSSLEPAPDTGPIELLKLENQNLRLKLKLAEQKMDDDTPIKRTVYWKGFEIGLQYQPFDLRHEKLLPCGYGEIVGTKGEDGMALDCYVGADLNSDRVFVVDQMNAETGAFDEHKLFLGFDEEPDYVKSLFISLMGEKRFGGIRETTPSKVWELHQDAIRMDKPCGKGFIAENKECHKTPQTGKAESASKSAGSNRVSPEKKLTSEIHGRLETFTDENGDKRWLMTPLSNADRYETERTGAPFTLETSQGLEDPITQQAFSLSLDPNQSLLLPAKGGERSSIEEEIKWSKAILHKALPVGGTFFVRPDEEAGLSPEKAEKIGEALGMARASIENPFKKGEESDFFFIGKYKDGTISKATGKDRSYIKTIRSLRQDQIYLAQKFSSLENSSIRPKGEKQQEINRLVKEEEQIASNLAQTEDQYLGREPTAIPPITEYKKKAEDWAKSQFGEVLEGANGFTLEQTLAHDIAHPVVHEMLGLNSTGISKRFKSAKQNDGKDSLVLEEAIVNVAEHLSRGDSIEASILNGMRLARVLSRNKKVQSDEVRKQVRSKEFNAELVKMSYDIYYHNNFSLYMKYVRETNRISGTVQQAGDDFTNTASGG